MMNLSLLAWRIRRRQGTRGLVCALLAMAALGASVPALAEPVVQRLPGPDNDGQAVDREFEETMDGPLMRFRYERFDVRPGELVRIELRNDDEMMHNFVLVRGEPGVDDLAIGEAAVQMDDAFDEQFVPDDERILLASPLLRSGESLTLVFRAPDEPGEYPYVCTFPGHAQTMRGVMRVRAEGEPLEAPVASTDEDEPEELEDRDYMQLDVTDEARVMRVLLPGLSSRSLAVGLPEQVHYAFDPREAIVAYAWQGAFLDLSDVRSGRGVNARAGLRGERFDLGVTGQPLRIGDPDHVPEVQFQGYSMTPAAPPTMLFNIDEYEIAQTVRALSGDRKALAYDYTIEPAPTHTVYFVFDDNSITARSPEGERQDGMLVINPEQAGTFTIELEVDSNE